MPLARRAPRVLVYQIGSLGDTIVSIPAYRMVRRHFGPDAVIDVFHNLPAGPAGARATPHQVLDGTGLVDGHVAYRQHARAPLTLLSMAWSLRRGGYDAVAYLLPGQRPAVSVERDRKFFQTVCRGARLIGFHAVDPGVFRLRATPSDPLPCPHESVLRARRFAEDGLASEPADFEPPLIVIDAAEQAAAAAWAADSAPGDAPLAALAPGANAPSNFWPQERFAEILRRLRAAGWRVALIGGPQETALAARLLETLTPAERAGVANGVGRFTVRETAAALQQARFLIGLDTGTTHIAAAVGTPVVCLFPDKSAPGQWRAMGRGNIVLRHTVPCGNCGLFVCSQPGHPCMTTITVEEVWDAALRQMRAAGPAATGIALPTVPA